MEDTFSGEVFVLIMTLIAWLGYKTYEPIKQWAWSDVKQNKKTHSSGSFRKKQVAITIPREVGK
ncbi:hypothetical protein COA08_01320 [Bacillus cereus]|uniref:Phage protein n=1 Tax=Bacillus cereus TaxID=1396 RepID=A0A2C0F0J6_BACCE|nr:hypothetical protein [Bacillus cereus]PGQ11966.1 hypothetical protein COA08_01320 [Bacillus cereus]